MRVIAAIDDPRVVEKTLRHLALWNDPPPSPPQGLPGFSPVGGEGGFEGRTGNWKKARRAPPPPPRACRGSRLSAGKGILRAVPAIGNEPGRATLPVVSAVLVRAQDIALFLAFPARSQEHPGGK